MALPRFLAIKSNFNQKYLQRFVFNDPDPQSFLRFSGENIEGPETKFEVEVSKNKVGMVHIRCCQNNKYWRRKSPTQHWIVAEADKPDEEDVSSSSSTLFELLELNVDAKTFRLRHVQLGHYTRLHRTPSPNHNICLFGESKVPDNKEFTDVFTFTEWEFVIPRFVALKSKKSNNYLQPVVLENKEANPDQLALVQASEESVVSPYTKHEVEMSKNHKGMVHVRSCYNNKYWRRKSSNSSDWWIVADADTTNEDKSNWSCTLFELSDVDDVAKTFRLRHAELGRYPILWTDPKDPHYLCLLAYLDQPDRNNDHDVFTFTDWESLLVLPRYVAFRGENGKYLRATTIEERPYLRFESNNSRDPLCWNEVFITPDGTVRIKNIHFNASWSVNSNWIWANSDDNALPNTLFQPVKVKGNTIALRNVGNKKFCKRLTAQNKESCLSADDPTISKFAILQVEELVNSRYMYDLDYRLSDAWIYDEEVISLTTGQAANWSKKSRNVAVRLSYKDFWSGAWSDNTSWKLGVVTNMEAEIPIIEDAGIKISSEFNGTYQWGETKSSTTEKQTLYNVTVPPMSEVTVTLLATKAKCEVPFSYYQHDTLFDEKKITNYMDGGFYSGINYFKFKYEVSKPKKLN